MPVVLWMLGADSPPLLSFTITMAAFLVYTHRGNIERMKGGKELRMNCLWLLRPRSGPS
jgi:glycerol-3-phosphate acyltransferase PlsY